MAQFAVNVMCHSERGPPTVTGLFSSSATKRPAAQKFDFVPGYKIIEDPRGHSAEVRKGSHMSFDERLSRLGRKRRHETVLRVRQANRQVVRLLLHAGDRYQRFAKVRLRFARRMRQKNEHLPTA